MICGFLHQPRSSMLSRDCSLPNRGLLSQSLSNNGEMAHFVEFRLSAKKMTMGNYEAWSTDACYGLRVPSRVIERMLELCQRTSYVETGGVLVGYYTKRRDCAIVTACSSAPKDSRSGSHYFQRGVHGLQQWLNALWRRGRRRYYLGEWHYHPRGSTDFSSIDVAQMKNNAEDDSYHCPEPVMLIIGGDPCDQYSIGSSVYVRDRGMLILSEGWEGSD